MIWYVSMFNVVSKFGKHMFSKVNIFLLVELFVHLVVAECSSLQLRVTHGCVCGSVWFFLFFFNVWLSERVCLCECACLIAERTSPEAAEPGVQKRQNSLSLTLTLSLILVKTQQYHSLIVCRPSSVCLGPCCAFDFSLSQPCGECQWGLCHPLFERIVFVWNWLLKCPLLQGLFFVNPYFSLLY